MADVRSSRIPAPVIALAGWVVPGLGYLLIGQRARGITVGATILVLFAMGILIGGIRVIDVPGFDNLGSKIMLDEKGARVQGHRAEQGVWALKSQPLQTVFEKPWFVGQVLTGPVCVLAAKWSVEVARPVNAGAVVSRVPASHSRVYEIGTLYAAIAGMLNLMAMIDSADRAGRASA